MVISEGILLDVRQQSCWYLHSCYFT